MNGQPAQPRGKPPGIDNFTIVDGHPGQVIDGGHIHADGVDAGGNPGSIDLPIMGPIQPMCNAILESPDKTFRPFRILCDMQAQGFEYHWDVDISPLGNVYVCFAILGLHRWSSDDEGDYGEPFCVLVLNDGRRYACPEMSMSISAPGTTK
jgi:hypothetical protein